MKELDDFFFRTKVLFGFVPFFQKLKIINRFFLLKNLCNINPFNIWSYIIIDRYGTKTKSQCNPRCLWGVHNRSNLSQEICTCTVVLSVPQSPCTSILVPQSFFNSVSLYPSLCTSVFLYSSLSVP